MDNEESIYVLSCDHPQMGFFTKMAMEAYKIVGYDYVTVDPIYDRVG